LPGCCLPLHAESHCCSLWYQEERCSAVISSPLHVPDAAGLVFGVHNNLQQSGRPT
jgi:hypothetical protein